MSADERQIREVHSTWIDAVNAGDLARLLTLVADDVVFLNPGQAPSGRAGFSAHFSAAQRQVRINCVSELEEVVVASDVAYTRSRDALSVTSRGGTEATQLAGHRITVYRKQPDGRWLLARDAHTLSPVERREKRSESAGTTQAAVASVQRRIGSAESAACRGCMEYT